MLESPIFRLLAMSSALLLSIDPAAASDAIDLEALVRGFAAMPGLSARFREEKHISLLQVPLVSEGVLYFAPPDRIARHVERPAPSTLLVRDDELVMGTVGERHTLDLASRRDASSLLSVSLAALTTLFSFGLLSLSSFPALRALGVATGIGVALSPALALCFRILRTGAARESSTEEKS